MAQNQILQSQKKMPCYVKERLGKKTEEKTASSNEWTNHTFSETLTHCLLPGGPGAPALWIWSSPQTPSGNFGCASQNSAYGSDTDKIKIWIYDGYQANLNGFHEYLPVACYQSLNYLVSPKQNDFCFSCWEWKARFPNKNSLIF